MIADGNTEDPPQRGPRSQCAACGARAVRSFLLRRGVPLLRCSRCGLGWWNWPPFDPRRFYDRDYFQSADAAKGYDDYRALEAGARATARARLRRMASLCGGRRAAGRREMLEVGCGTGCFLCEARAAGWDARGIEVSSYAVARARERGLSVTCAAIEDIELARSAYDGIALWDVIEHLRDPASLLRALGRALRPGGVLALSTGDITSLCARLSGPRWHLFNLPEHLYFFSPQALRRILGAAGLRLGRVVREVNWVPMAYLLERIRKSAATNRNRSSPHEPVKDEHRARIRNGLIDRLVVPATLFDVLGVYALRDFPSRTGERALDARQAPISASPDAGR